MCHLSKICFYAWWNTAYNAVAGLILRGQGKENVRGVPLSHCGRSFCLIISWHCLRVSRTVLLNSVDGSNNVFLPIKLLKSHLWAKPLSLFLLIMLIFKLKPEVYTIINQISQKYLACSKYKLDIMKWIRCQFCKFKKMLFTPASWRIAWIQTDLKFRQYQLIEPLSILFLLGKK